MNSITNNENRTAAQPRCDIRKEGDAVRLHVEMPGVGKDGVEVSVEKNELVISGRAESAAAEGEYLLRERRGGEYRKRFIIDDTIDRDRIEAVVSDGVLSLTLHTKEAAKPRKIEIR